MLEKMFTTKMSMDKKIIQQRFLKIRSKNGKKSKLIAAIIFFVVIAIIVASAIYVAVKKSNDNVYAMSDEDFAAYISNPIGAIMAEIDYVDNEKIVFHYGKGFFITNEQTKEIEHKIDLSKLSSALPVQADTILKIAIDKNGDYAYLESTGVIAEAQEYESFVVDLNTGKVEIGKMPEGTELFTSYEDTMLINTHGGWPSNRFINYDNKAYYLLYRQYETIGDIQLVTIDYNDGEKTDFRNIFGTEYISTVAREQRLIANALEAGEVKISGETNWRLDGYDARQIIDELSSSMNMKKLDVKDGTYKIIEYSTELEGSGAPRIVIINTDNMELLFSARFDESVKEIYSELKKILNEKGIYMCNIENYTYNEILTLQTQVGNGHYPWRLDVEETLKTFFEMNDNDLMTGGKISDITSNEFGCSGTYIKNGGCVNFEMIRPLNRKNSIWIIKNITDVKRVTTATIEKADLFDEDGKQIIPDANWYPVGERCTASLYISGLREGTITAYYTDSGTEMEGQKKVVGNGKPTWDMTTVELAFEDGVHGHLWFVLDLGTHEVQSEIYNVFSKESLLSGMMNVDKDFEMTDLNGMNDIRLIFDGEIYKPNGITDVRRIEQILSSAKPIKFGKPGCPFKATLIVFNKVGYKSKIELATDSCAAFGFGKTYYDYGDDNEELYNLFGIDGKTLPDLN